MSAYSSTEFLRIMMDRVGRAIPADLSNREALAAWQDKAREKLRELLTQDAMDKCRPLELTYEWMPVPGDLVRERCVLQTEQDVWMPFFVLRKEGTTGPAVIIVPQDGTGKFGSVWADDYEWFHKQDEAARTRFLRRWEAASKLAAEGCLVVAPDIRGTGERREWMDEGEDRFSVSSRRPVNNVAIALGQSLAGETCHELSMLADLMRARRDCDGRVYLAGYNDGAAMALFAAAADASFDGLAILNGFCGFRDGVVPSASSTAGTYVPNLYRWFERGDVGALVAPRPMVLVISADDPQNGPEFENALPQIDELKKAYDLLGAHDRLIVRSEKAVVDVLDAGHLSLVLR